MNVHNELSQVRLALGRARTHAPKLNTARVDADQAVVELTGAVEVLYTVVEALVKSVDRMERS